MNHFKIFQASLEKTYPSLTVFSDMNWDDVAKEYIASHDEHPDNVDDFTFNFPQFLQEKAIDGDCPSYLFELAFFELIRSQIMAVELELPASGGLHLNPSLSFLNLEFDVGQMLDDAAKGSVHILERSHVLCLYRHPSQGLSKLEITSAMLEILQGLEDGSLSKREDVSAKSRATLAQLIDLGVIIDVRN